MVQSSVLRMLAVVPSFGELCMVARLLELILASSLELHESSRLHFLMCQSGCVVPESKMNIRGGVL